jgi:hypothetical protein
VAPSLSSAYSVAAIVSALSEFRIDVTAGNGKVGYYVINAFRDFNRAAVVDQAYRLGLIESMSLSQSAWRLRLLMEG